MKKSNIGDISITLFNPLFLLLFLLHLSYLLHQCPGFENCTLQVRRNCVGDKSTYVFVCVCVSVYTCIYIHINSHKSSIFIVPLNTAAVTGILLEA